MSRTHKQKDRPRSGPFTEAHSSNKAHGQYRRYEARELKSRKAKTIRAQLPADMPREIKRAVSLAVSRLETLADAGKHPPGLKLDYPSLDGGYSTFVYLPADLAAALAADFLYSGDRQA